MPDMTLGGFAPPTGALSLETLRLSGGSEGISLVYAGVDPSEEWTYSVLLAEEAGKRVLVVRCAETLWYQVYPVADPQQTALQILADIDNNNERFSQWRAEGGEVSYKERLSVPKTHGLPPSRGFVEFIERRYRESKTMEDGPKEAWWQDTNTKVAMGQAIQEGQGNAPAYRLGPVPETPEAQKAENRPYVNQLRNAGIAMVVTGMVSALQGFALLTFAASRMVKWHGWVPDLQWEDTTRMITAGVAAVYFVGTAIYTGVVAGSGNGLRFLNGRNFVKIGAWVAMVPLLCPIFVAGIPVGIWVHRLLRDPRAPSIVTD